MVSAEAVRQGGLQCGCNLRANLAVIKIRQCTQARQPNTWCTMAPRHPKAWLTVSSCRPRNLQITQVGPIPRLGGEEAALVGDGGASRRPKPLLARHRR